MAIIACFVYSLNLDYIELRKKKEKIRIDQTMTKYQSVSRC